MSDRELIEKAAKASGTVGEWADKGELLKDQEGICTFLGFGRVVLWNPLRDNGDALELAIRLRLDIHYETQFFNDEAIDIVEIFYDRDPDAGSCKCEMLSLGPDPSASTRRAIVTAASKVADTHTC